MKCETYKSTPGIDRIPPAERFATHRAIHNRLMREDASYRQRHQRYVVSYSIIIAAAFLAVLTNTPGLFGSLLLAFAATAVVVYLALREQHRINQHIGRVLLSHE